MEFASLAARFGLSVVFLVAGLSKLSAPKRFVGVVRDFELLPGRLVTPLATWLPRLEILCAILLVLGAWQQAAPAVVASMLVLFSGAVAVNLLRGRRIDCGCLTITGHSRITWWTLARNLVLAACAILVAVVPTSTLTVGGTSGNGTAIATREGIAVLIASTVIVVGALLVAETRRLATAASRFISLDSSGGQG